MNREDTEQLLDEFHTPIHVRAHCFQVARIGEHLANKLSEAGEDVDSDLVWIAGMIHDFVRVVDFKELPEDLGTDEDQEVWKSLRQQYGGRHHAEVGAEILNEMGEEELSRIIRQHKYGSMLTEDSPSSWEAKLVYYADKRVAHDQIVSLEERLSEGRKRYRPDTPLNEEDKKRHDAIEALEKEIFDKIDIEPSDLAAQLGET